MKRQYYKLTNNETGKGWLPSLPLFKFSFLNLRTNLLRKIHSIILIFIATSC